MKNLVNFTIWQQDHNEKTISKMLIFKKKEFTKLRFIYNFKK